MFRVSSPFRAPAGAALSCPRLRVGSSHVRPPARGAQARRARAQPHPVARAIGRESV